MRFFRSAILLFILVVLPVMLFSQAYFGTVSGDVADPSGAMVPGAKVTLIDQQKGYKFNATSDHNGRYLFTSIPPGVYTVSVVVQGFDKTERTNIRVNVSDNVTANLSLAVATSRQAVEVQAQAQPLETEDAVTGQVVNRRFINDLPLV